MRGAAMQRRRPDPQAEDAAGTAGVQGARICTAQLPATVQYYIINNGTFPPRHGQKKVPVSDHVAYSGAERARHHGQGGRERCGLGHRRPAHQEVDSHRVGHRLGKVRPASGGEKDGVGGQGRRRRRWRGERHGVHKGQGGVCGRAPVPHRGGGARAPECRCHQVGGRPLRDGRPGAVDGQGRGAEGRCHDGPAARLRPLALARGARRCRRVQDRLCSVPRHAGRQPDLQGRRHARQGRPYGGGRARCRCARLVRDVPGGLPGVRGRRQEGQGKGPCLHGACARPPEADGRGQGGPLGCDRGGPELPSCVPRAGAPGAARRPVRGRRLAVRKVRRDRPVVRAGARVPRACAAHAGQAGRRARTGAVRRRPRARSP